ncbi:serum response factor homolog [Lucilia sericata]|uniref:serum response factor homolog n=1 Tax=Lucilia sericata TaxID=13632 RepID=UPI0018A80247|nr:serum response factor homolog [Lucilia sericata]
METDFLSIFFLCEVRSPISSTNDSDESSDLEGITNVSSNNCLNTESAPEENIINIDSSDCKSTSTDNKDNKKEMFYPTTFESKRICKYLQKGNLGNKNGLHSLETRIHQPTDNSNVPQNVLLQLIEAGHLEVHTEEDGSGHQYVAIPIPPSTTDRVESGSNNDNDDRKTEITSKPQFNLQTEIPKLLIKEED